MSKPIALLASLSVLFAMPLAAEAKAPPKGKYDCTIGSILFGTLTIKGGSKYSHRGTNGTFTHGKSMKTFHDGIRGWTLKFKKGDLGGMRGRWYKGNDGTPEGTYEIALRNPRDDFESIYCGKRK